MRDGHRVLYHPVIGRAEAHEGTIDGEPRLLGKSWVVNLKDMASTYRNGERTRVVAAFTAALEPAEPNALVSFRERWNTM
jgi:hypothetical protein